MSPPRPPHPTAPRTCSSRSWAATRTRSTRTAPILAKGAHLSADPLHGARNVCYALLNQVGGSTALGAENPDQRARISARIYGPSKEAASLAATAYANALVALATGGPVAVTGALIVTVDPDTIAGPLWTPDFGEPRYLVDADFYLRPA
jgi:hypothetical protein